MTNDETNANKEGKLSLWQQIKEDFSVPKLNDPALDSSFELFEITQVTLKSFANSFEQLHI